MPLTGTKEEKENENVYSVPFEGRSEGGTPYILNVNDAALGSNALLPEQLSQ